MTDAYVTFFVPGIATPKQSTRFVTARNGRVHAHRDPRVEAWEQTVALFARQAWTGDPLTGDVAVSVTFIRPRRSADLDNLQKGVLDAVKKIIFADDKQVVEIHAYKRFPRQGAAGVWVTVAPYQEGRES